MTRSIVVVLFVGALLSGGLVVNSSAVFAGNHKAVENASVKGNAAEENPGKKKGLEKCEKLTDATKKQACIAQEAQARKNLGKSKGKDKKDNK